MKIADPIEFVDRLVEEKMDFRGPGEMDDMKKELAVWIFEEFTPDGNGLSIVSDGTVPGTEVYGPEGNTVDGIVSMNFSMDASKADSYTLVELEIYPEKIDLNLDDNQINISAITDVGNRKNHE